MYATQSLAGVSDEVTLETCGAGSNWGSGSNMFAINGATGKILWRYKSGGSVMGGAAIVNGTVYWASGYLHPRCSTTPPTCGKTYRLYAFGL